MGFISMKIGKPVKWIESRRENCMATIHGRGHVDHLKSQPSATEQFSVEDSHPAGPGRIPSAPDSTDPDTLRTHDSRPLPVSERAGRYNGCIHELRSNDAYRGAGRPEATHAIEIMVDMLAAELKMDPVDIRIKNFPQPSEFPFATATGLMYDSGNYEAPLRKALETIGYEQLRREQAEARAAGKLMGIGISTYGEICAFGPSPATPAGGWESATVKVEPSGQVTVLTGVSPHGQGEETTFAQITADELGVPIDNVVVLHGDTAVVQYGIGTFGSRATAVGGAALYLALQEIKTKMRRFGEMLLESDDVTLGQRTLRL